MRKIFLFATLSTAILTMLLVSGSCTKKAAAPLTPTPVQEDLTVVIGSVSVTGDTTVYLQSVVRRISSRAFLVVFLPNTSILPKGCR